MDIMHVTSLPCNRLSVSSYLSHFKPIKNKYQNKKYLRHTLETFVFPIFHNFTYIYYVLLCTRCKIQNRILHQKDNYLVHRFNLDTSGKQSRHYPSFNYVNICKFAMCIKNEMGALQTQVKPLTIRHSFHYNRIFAQRFPIFSNSTRSPFSVLSLFLSLVMRHAVQIYKPCRAQKTPQRNSINEVGCARMCIGMYYRHASVHGTSCCRIIQAIRISPGTEKFINTNLILTITTTTGKVNVFRMLRNFYHH